MSKFEPGLGLGGYGLDYITDSITKTFLSLKRSTCDGVSRLGLGLETCLDTSLLESRSQRSEVTSRSRRISVSISSSSSRDFAKFCMKEFLKKCFQKMIVESLAFQRGQWLSFFVVTLFASWRK